MSFNYDQMEIINIEDGGRVDYFPKFISNEFSHELFEELSNLHFEQPEITVYNKNVKIPRLQCWMADSNIVTYLYQKTPPTPWSEKLLVIKEHIERMYNFKFDYVLINYYRNGDDYISYHSDREAIGQGKNIIAGLSLGATRKFVLKHNDCKARSIKNREFMLEKGSLIVMLGDNTQKFWKHTITKTKCVDSPRINLTFRHS